MIYYPLSVLIFTGIREFLIILTSEYISLYKKMLGNGSKVGLKCFYKIQTQPRGLVDAFIIGKKFIEDEKVALILGNNIFFGQCFTPVLNEASNFVGTIQKRKRLYIACIEEIAYKKYITR